MFCGAIEFGRVDSTLPGAPSRQARARYTVFLAAAPSTATASIGCLDEGGVGVAACATRPPSLNAHKLSPRGEL